MHGTPEESALTAPPADSVAEGYSPFRSIAYPLRVYAGRDALAQLPDELRRHGVTRALILCGRSVRTKTPLISRIEQLCGNAHALTCDFIAEGAPREAVEHAVGLARECGADGIVAVGAGSVTKAARVVAILLAEGQPVETLATQHEAGKRAYSPKLLAPKCPIINVITAATTSQSRAGASIHDPAQGRQWEFYDPKVRPRALFWDTDALATAPLSLTRSAGAWLYWRALMNLGAARDANPLVRANREQAYVLIATALDEVGGQGDARARIDLCAAALMQMRDEDDGGNPMSAHILVRVIYVLAVALFNVRGINQTRAAIALTAPAIREFGPLCPDVLPGLSEPLGVPKELATDAGATAAAWLEKVTGLGWDSSLNEQDVPAAAHGAIISYALGNFNSNHDRLLDRHVERLRRVLQALN